MQKIVCENINFVWETETISLVIKMWKGNDTFDFIAKRVKRPTGDLLCLLIDLSIRGKIKKRAHYLTIFGDA